MIRYNNLLREAIETIPEFEKEYENAIKEDLIDKESGLHVVFGYTFTPLLVESIKNDKTLAKEMFDFMEKMSESDDKRVKEVCDFSILEVVCDNFSDREVVQLMGEKTLLGYNKVRQYIGV